MSDFICLRRFGQRIEADMIKGLLEYRGIDVRIDAIKPGNDPPCDGIDEVSLALMVRARDFARADSILKATFTDI